MTMVYDSARLLGRRKLYSYLTPEDLIDVDYVEKIKQDLLQYILPLHAVNAEEEQFLWDYHAGFHPAITNRVKEVRGDVDNRLSINWAKSFTRDIVSYTFSKPAQYVQRKQEERDLVDKLNDALDAENKHLVNFEVGERMSICGVGYMGVFPEKDPRNGTHICLCSLEPQTTFVVWSPDKRIGALYCGTFYTTPPNPFDHSSKTVYTIYTKTKKLVFEAPGVGGISSDIGLKLVEEADANLGGFLPIIEFDNNSVRSGDWESEVSIMDALDVVGSDSVNDIVQFVNSLLLMQGFEVTDDTLKDMEQNKILNIPDVPPGVTIDVRYIADLLDSDGVGGLRDWLEKVMRSIVGVPDRKTRSGGGGDTGDAVFMRDGWQDIDLVATNKDNYFISSDREALSVILHIMHVFGEIDRELLAQNVEIKFSRTKQTNLQAKAQAYSTLVGAASPVNPGDALEMVDLTNNVDDVMERSEHYIEEQRKIAMETMKMSQSFQADNKNNSQESNMNKKEEKSQENQ